MCLRYLPSYSYCQCIAFIVDFVVVFANIYFERNRHLLFRSFSRSCEQLFHLRRSNLCEPRLAKSPYCLIRHSDDLEQRSCLMRESGEPLFPHEYSDVHSQLGNQIVNLGQYLAVAFLLASVVQVAKPFYRRLAAFVSQNGEPRASLRQVSSKDTKGFRRRHLPGLAHDRPRRRTSSSEWRDSDGHHFHLPQCTPTCAGWHG